MKTKAETEMKLKREQATWFYHLIRDHHIVNIRWDGVYNVKVCRECQCTVNDPDRSEVKI